jgi:predicted CXXCH cytochrome family protein
MILYRLMRAGVILIGLGSVFLLDPSIVRAEDPQCTTCHEDLTNGASVHPAVTMGCTVCHAGVDASEIPHRFTTKHPKGLGSRLRDICYDCHERGSFMKKTVHGALMLGCTTCHNPHRSDHVHLLNDEITSLCMGCHQERFAPGKGRSHVLAGNEACAGCHDPHTSDLQKLLLENEPALAVPQTARAPK